MRDEEGITMRAKEALQGGQSASDTRRLGACSLLYSQLTGFSPCFSRGRCRAGAERAFFKNLSPQDFMARLLFRHPQQGARPAPARHFCCMPGIDVLSGPRNGIHALLWPVQSGTGAPSGSGDIRARLCLARDLQFQCAWPGQNRPPGTPIVCAARPGRG